MIEIGKKYVTFGHNSSFNNNKVVTVLGFYCKAGEVKDGYKWGTHQGDYYVTDNLFLDLYGDKIRVVGEKHLRPIDDDWISPVSWEECIWNPNKQEINSVK